MPPSPKHPTAAPPASPPPPPAPSQELALAPPAQASPALAEPEVLEAVVVKQIQAQETSLLRMASDMVARHVSRALPAQKWARELEILSDADLELVAEDRSDLKRILKEIEEGRKLVAGPLGRLKTVIDAFFKKCAEPFEVADELVSTKISDYRERQRQAAAAEQERLRKEADERARKDREEHARQVKAYEEAQEKARKEQEAREAAIRVAEAKKGKKASLAPLPPPPPPVAPPPPPPPPPVYTPAPVIPSAPKTVGSMTFRGQWQCEVQDFMGLVKAVATGQVSVSVLLPNQTILNELVRKQSVREIPGCKIWEKEIDATRT